MATRIIHPPLQIGQVFDRLTILRPTPPTHTHRKWHCRCECGEVRDVREYDLRNGKHRSCGCLRRETTTKSKTIHGMASEGHRHPLYVTWINIKKRCENPHTPRFADYGGRGITIDPTWRESFLQFLADMGEKPGPEFSVERRDNNGPYCKDNCIWADRLTQGANKRSNRRWTHNGETLTLTQWARRTGMRVGSLWQRVFRDGWPIERALTEPSRLQPHGTSPAPLVAANAPSAALTNF